jgi:CspA family cold shock protein
MEYEEMQTGKVKWFNNAKGYGFILSDEGGEDMFAHYSSIQTEGYKTLKAGQSVEFDTKPSDQGTHAINIQPLDMLSPGQEQQVSNAEKVLNTETQDA